jgi:hypothetical protein
MLDRPELQEFFQSEALAEAGRKRRAEYTGAEPFPHIVMDGFFPEVLVRELAAAITPPDDSWIRRERDTAVKRGNPDETSMDPAIQAFLYKLHSAAFLRFLEELTGIERLLPDPYFHGGGIHQSEPGGFLNIHADFNVHKSLGLDRRLNLLLYLNDPWQDAWGGQLELWDREMQHCVHRLAPVMNRCVIFSTTSTSYHGHPEPVACPEGNARKSLALYYYTAGRPEEERSARHSTLYQTPGVRPEAPPRDADGRSWFDRLAARFRGR